MLAGTLTEFLKADVFPNGFSHHDPIDLEPNFKNLYLNKLRIIKQPR